MKIVKVEFKSENKDAVFCDITLRYKPLFGMPYIEKREVYLKKYLGGIYDSFPKFSDTGRDTPMYDTIALHMKRSIVEKVISIHLT